MPDDFGGGGRWIIAALKEFLGLADNFEAEKNCEGFLVNPLTGDKTMVPRRGLLESIKYPAAFARFALKEEDAGDWNFTLPPRPLPKESWVRI